MNIQPSQIPSTGEVIKFVIDTDSAGQRLDRYVVGVTQDISRMEVQRLIGNDAILVNGKASKAGYMLRAGDVIAISSVTSATSSSSIQPLSIPLTIAYEDADVLVINKPAGMVVHPAPGHRDDTLVNALLAYLPELQASGDANRPGIVHRLDKDTSGLLLVAKNARAHHALFEQMKRHEIVKRYIALVEGHVTLDQGSIDAPIGRDPRHRQQMAITVVGSRDALTHFQVLQRFSRHTLLALRLETGRTHQIRLHLKAIGHPVVSDQVYGSGNVLKHVKLTRQFLHANQLQFHHPTTGELVVVEAALPDDLQAVLDNESFL